MLTKDLLRFRTRDDKIFPQFLELGNGKAIDAFVSKGIGVCQSSLGREILYFEERWKELCLSHETIPTITQNLVYKYLKSRFCTETKKYPQIDSDRFITEAIIKGQEWRSQASEDTSYEKFKMFAESQFALEFEKIQDLIYPEQHRNLFVTEWKKCSEQDLVDEMNFRIFEYMIYLSDRLTFCNFSLGEKNLAKPGEILRLDGVQSVLGANKDYLCDVFSSLCFLIEKNISFDLQVEYLSNQFGTEKKNEWICSSKKIRKFESAMNSLLGRSHWFFQSDEGDLIKGFNRQAEVKRSPWRAYSVCKDLEQDTLKRQRKYFELPHVGKVILKKSQRIKSQPGLVTHKQCDVFFMNYLNAESFNSFLNGNSSGMKLYVFQANLLERVKNDPDGVPFETLGTLGTSSVKWGNFTHQEEKNMFWMSCKSKVSVAKILQILEKINS